MYRGGPAILKSPFVDIPEEAQARMLVAQRRVRYGYRVARHILLWCADRHTPTEIAVVLFCSQPSMNRMERAYRQGTLALEHDGRGRLTPPVCPTMLVPTLRRSLLALLKGTTHA